MADPALAFSTTSSFVAPGATRSRSGRRPQSRYQSDFIEFGAYPGAVPSARLHARAVLGEWGMEELADDAGQIISELVGNAVEAHEREGLAAPVRLTLIAGLRTLLIVVRDASNATAELGSPDIEDEHGRGLLIVDALSDLWNTKSFPEGGKVVRALLRGQCRAGTNAL